MLPRASSLPRAACKTRDVLHIDSIDALSNTLKPTASSAIEDRSEMAPLVFRPWLFFLFILTFSWHYRIMWQRKAWGRGKEGKEEEGVGGQCSQKHKNKRTANWDFSKQAPSFQKVSVDRPSSPRTPSSGLAWTKWELPSQYSSGSPLCSHPTFLRGASHCLWGLHIPNIY